MLILLKEEITESPNVRTEGNQLVNGACQYDC